MRALFALRPAAFDTIDKKARRQPSGRAEFDVARSEKKIRNLSAWITYRVASRSVRE